MSTSTDQRADVVAFLVPILRQASRDADAVNIVLETLGVVPPLPERQARPIAVAPDLLLKIAAWVRLAHWERSGLRPHLRTDLPPARDVLADIFGFPEGSQPRFDAHALVKAVLHVHAMQLAWSRLPDTAAEVAVAQTLSSEEAVELLAQFLWQFRHVGS